jgi:hypothetical protein
VLALTASRFNSNPSCFSPDATRASRYTLGLPRDSGAILVILVTQANERRSSSLRQPSRKRRCVASAKWIMIMTELKTEQCFDLSEADLNRVVGGLNPQPLPPMPTPDNFGFHGFNIAAANKGLAFGLSAGQQVFIGAR